MSGTSAYDPDAFREFERAGWNGVATDYNDLFGTATTQAAAALLDAAGARFGTRLLDLACGTGVVAAGALMRGCTVVGADFAGDMIAEAARRWPGAEFRCCDAEETPFPDAAFDAVVSNFGFIHFSRPEDALAETARTLKPGGRLALTAWTHDAGHRRLMEKAVQTHGEAQTPLLAGPPAPFYAEKDACARAFEAAGFTKPQFLDLTLYMRAEAPARIVEIIEKSTVRTAARLRAQPPRARERIKEAIRESVMEFACEEGVIRLPMEATLVHARKRRTVAP